MPQTVDAQLLARFQGTATTNAMLLEIIRADGTKFCFSTASSKKTWTTPNGASEFAPGGFDPTNITTTYDAGIAGVEITAFFQGSLTELDVRMGKFDGAVAAIYKADWLFPQYGVMPIFKGTILSSGVSNDGAVKFVLTGQIQKALRPLGGIRSAVCRAMFGDPLTCKFPIENHVREATVASLVGNILTLNIDGDIDAQAAGDHLLWRVHMSVFGDAPAGSSGEGVPSYTEITLLEISPTVGGPSYIITGVVDGASTDYEYGGHSHDAWQGNRWQGQQDTWNGILLNAPGPALQFKLRSGNAYYAPRSVKLEWSDNADDIRGGPWHEVIGFGQSGLTWTDNETKTFVRTGGDVNTSYNAGLVKFLEGNNLGEAFDIIDYEEVGDLATVRLAIVPPQSVTVGEDVLIYPGCDKTLTRCKYWGNVVNRRAEDYIPTATFQGQNRLIE